MVYWDLGNMLSAKIKESNWGDKVLENVSKDLNVVSSIPWKHIVEITTKFKTYSETLFSFQKPKKIIGGEVN